MKTTILIAMVLSLASASAANAYHTKPHKRAHPYGPAVAYVPASPYYAAHPRPIWGAPQQCFTDEGYGRYWPCGAGPSTR